MNKQIKIGIVGGCAISQKNIPLKSRFYSILSEKIKTNLSHQTVFSFSTYSDYSSLSTKCYEVSNKSHLDFMVIHLRPQPFYIISKLFIKYENELNDDMGICINPLLYGRTWSNHLKGDPVPTFNYYSVKPRFMDLNIFLGNIFRLHTKASIYIYNQIMHIQSYCQLNHIKLIILGIPYQPFSKIGNLNCKKLNLSLMEKLSNDKNIENFECYTRMESNSYFEKDNLHLSINGHYTLGSILFEGIKPILV